MGDEMEYAIVRLLPSDPHDEREVLASGAPLGRTAVELTLPADFYHITLSGAGYTPAFWEGPINGTDVHHPIEIVFHRA
jgi:hypothetical protein